MVLRDLKVRAKSLRFPRAPQGKDREEASAAPPARGLKRPPAATIALVGVRVRIAVLGLPGQVVLG